MNEEKNEASPVDFMRMELLFLIGNPKTSSETASQLIEILKRYDNSIKEKCCETADLRQNTIFDTED
jgi:hypothetical protein